MGRTDYLVSYQEQDSYERKDRKKSRTAIVAPRAMRSRDGTHKLRLGTRSGWKITLR